jgi:uncharacterized protein YndB with AHSA1/START domain
MSGANTTHIKTSDIETSDTALRIERLIAASPESLFALWIDPTQVAKWWAPEGCQASVHTLEPTPGGRWRVSLCGPDGFASSMSGVYRAVEPPHRLAFTCAWDGEAGARGHESEVTVHFEPAPGGTRLVLVHERFEDRPARDRHTNGWSAVLAKLSGLATGMGGPDGGL